MNLVYLCVTVSYADYLFNSHCNMPGELSRDIVQYDCTLETKKPFDERNQTRYYEY